MATIPLCEALEMVYAAGPVLLRILFLTCLASCALGDDALDDDTSEDTAEATGATTVWYTTITREYFLPSAKVAGEVHRVFKSEAEWTAFWGTASPGIDFAHNWAVFYTPGTQRADLAVEAGWHAKLTKVSLSATGKTLLDHHEARAQRHLRDAARPSVHHGDDRQAPRGADLDPVHADRDHTQLPLMRVLVLLLVLHATGCHDADWLMYGWDDRQVLCSDSVDNLGGGVDRSFVEQAFTHAYHENQVALFHAHVPGETVTREMVAWLLDTAEAYHLDFVGYDELDPDHRPRAGFALAFDDSDVDSWLSTRDLFAAHGARVTFFVTRFDRFTPEMTSGLAVLAADGHDIEAHSVNHLHEAAYISEHGLDAYTANEVEPSFEILRAAGYSPSVYAFPFGEARETTWKGVLSVEGIDRVRVSPSACPY